MNLYKKAYSYLNINDEESAKNIYLEVEKREELTEESLFNLSRIYEEEWNHEEADKYYDKILSQNPKSEEALQKKHII